MRSAEVRSCSNCCRSPAGTPTSSSAKTPSITLPVASRAPIRCWLLSDPDRSCAGAPNEIPASGVAAAVAVAPTTDPADADELAAVAALTFPLACPPELSAADAAHFVAANLSADHFRSHLAGQDSHVLKAVDPASDSIVGYALLVDGEPTDPDVREAITARPLTMISKMYVLPRFHGRTVSARLMDAALSHGRTHGSALVWLGVNEQNVRAQRFYQKMGFAVVGRKSFVVNGKRCSDFVLARPPAI
ncbi:GNAT family N-acetyltransferase [Williamsia sp. 1138]|nr:GNAT family N-acetyltransferase [Williamsia sp. 1138]